MPSDEPADNPSGAEPLGSGDNVALEEVLDQYLAELAAGESPDQQSYLRAHPELADALKGVFKTLEFVEATSRSLSASALEADQVLGDFRIVKEIGRGGMGVVYEAVQTSLDRRVALKILPSTAVLSDTASERFNREAATAGRLHHTNIVPVYAVGEEQGIPYYAMQFIEGDSLSQELRRIRGESARPDQAWYRRVARWGRQVADALAYAHEQGIVHRDIKPSNLLLDARDNVWVTDFGLARADAQASITVSGDVVGTVRYMSPEQTAGGRSPIDARSDVYSLGATLYELLALKPAFDGDSREGVLNQIATVQPRPLRQMNREIPRDLETIVAKCMEKDRARRYQNAADVADDCRRFAAGEPIRARRTPVVVKVARFVNRRRLPFSAAAVIGLLILAFALTTVGFRRAQGNRLVNDAFDAMLMEHDLDRVDGLLAEAESLGVDSPDLHLCRSLGPLFNAQPQRALPHLTEALKRDPDHVDALLAAAYAHFTMGEEVSGQQCMDSVDDQDIASPLGWLIRGYISDLDESGEALEAYDRALALRHDFTPAIEARAYYRADRLLIDGDRSQLQPMLDDFEAWVRFWPDSSRSYSARAAGRATAGAYASTQPDLRDQRDELLDGALADLDTAIRLKKGSKAGLLTRRGSWLRYLGDFAGSAEAFRAAIELDTEAAGDAHPGYMHHLLLALHAMGRLDEALAELDAVEESMPDFFALPLQRAMLLADLGRLDEAREIARQTLHEQRESETGLVLTAATMMLLGESDEAAGYAQQFLARTGSSSPDVEFLAGLGDAESLMQAAGNHPGRRCASSYLVGCKELGSGNRVAGLTSLEECLDTGVYIYVQYRFSQVLVARAQSDPAWPGWTKAAD